MMAAKTSSSERATRSLSTSNVRTLTPEYGTAIGCVIAGGTSIEGQMKTTENIRLDGKLKGSLSCEKRLVIGTNGKIEGKVWASEADISGTVEGDLEIDGLLILRASAMILGEIKAKSVQIELGASYNGSCEIG